MNRRPITSLFLLFVVLAVLPPPAPAARLADLYTAEVVVPGRAAADRQAALQDALTEVLLRLLGSTDLLQEPAVRKLAGQAQRYVEQYSYRRGQPESPDAEPPLLLRVRFDGVALTRALRTAGLPVWGQERPDVLVWLAVDDGRRRYLLSEQSRAQAARALRQAARRRGLPLVLPLMDLEDRRQVKFADVWGGFLEPVQQASQRYRAQVLLIGRLHRTASGGWQGRWTLVQAGAGPQGWESRGATLQQSVAAGLGESAELLALRYAVRAGPSDADNSGLLRVSGVETLADYARVQKYLESLSPVEAAQLQRVEGDSAEFGLRLNGARRSLQQVIAIGRVLVPAGDGQPGHYRLRK